jgi:hypothetical protein
VFGVGLLACFTVAETITVVSRSAKTPDAPAVRWTARDDGSYSISPAELRRYILTLAVQGKLVPQDTNDESAEGRLRGLTGAGAYVDELTLIPQGFFKRLIDRQSIDGAKIFATTNPDNPGHWVKKDWLNVAREKHTRSWRFTMDDNPGLSDSYRARMRRSFTGLWYRRYILGHWVMSEGAIYEGFVAARPGGCRLVRYRFQGKKQRLAAIPGDGLEMGADIDFLAIGSGEPQGAAELGADARAAPDLTGIP